MESIEDSVGGDSDDVSFLRTNDMVILCCSHTTNSGQTERLCLAAEGFGNRNCYLENLTDKSVPADISMGAFVIDQALSVRALQEMLSAKEDAEQGSQSHRTLLYGHAVLLKHFLSTMYLTCLPSTSAMDKLAFEVGLTEVVKGESCWWTVHPTSKQRSEGEKVRIGDDLILISVSSERYLHTVKNKRSHALVIASFSQTIWSIGPYASGNIRNKCVGFVIGGEVLRFLHGQDECLTVAKPDSSTSSHRHSSENIQNGANSGDDINPRMSTASLLSSSHTAFAAFSSDKALLSTSSSASNPSSFINRPVMYESGLACHQARSLWQLEYLKTKYNGGLMGWASPIRIKHVTSGNYLSVVPVNKKAAVAQQSSRPKKGEAADDQQNLDLSLLQDDGEHGDRDSFAKVLEGKQSIGSCNWTILLLSPEQASMKRTLFCLRPSKDDKKALNLDEDKEEESMGTPVIKYGDTMVFVQHIHSGLWLSYETYETKKKGIGRVEEKKAVMLEEGHMDDGFTFTMALEEESRSARVIRKSTSIFEKFLREINILLFTQKPINLNLNEMHKCLEDLIEYFATPSSSLSHEVIQLKLKAIRNRQDLYQEEGIISILLVAIDKFSSTDVRNKLANFLDETELENCDIICDQFYILLASIIRGNRSNCAKFAQINRLNWLFSQLESQQASKGALDVLQYILVDSPEVLNMITVNHIKTIISMLDKQGRDHKILNVLCSLCVGNGVAVRNNQHLIFDHLIPPKDILLQTKLVDHIICMRPNLQVGLVENSSIYKKWYFEAVVDYIEKLSETEPHLRIGWGNDLACGNYPGAGIDWGYNGVGDDYYSYGFDGKHLWTGGEKYAINDTVGHFKQNDVVGCTIDIGSSEIAFTLNGQRVMGEFKNFGKKGKFYPMISMSAKISVRFLFGSDHGQLKYKPPALFAPLSESVSPTENVKILSLYSMGDINKGEFIGPHSKNLCQEPFVPSIIAIDQVKFPNSLEILKNKLAENLHELWAKSKIDQGWVYGRERSDDNKTHPYLVSYENLPIVEKNYDNQQAIDTILYLMSLGYAIKLDTPSTKVKSHRLTSNYQMTNGFKPAPLDLTGIPESDVVKHLTKILADNLHNIWAQDRITCGWSYGPYIDETLKRTPFLTPYNYVPKFIKEANEDIAKESIKTILVYGYTIDMPPESREKQKISKQPPNITEFRTYRGQKTYAVTSGKWYYEVSILTSADILLGWCSPLFPCTKDLGCDNLSYAYNGVKAVKYHVDSENYGRRWKTGDVIGCLLDLHDCNIHYTLNGELLLDSLGAEYAFESIDSNMEGGYVPAFSLGPDQRIKVNFGHDVRTLKYFTNYGLKEGYEPYGVNMSRSISFWYDKPQGVFENFDNRQNDLMITKIPASGESPPSFKISTKGQSKTAMNYIRFNMPVIIYSKFAEIKPKSRTPSFRLPGEEFGESFPRATLSRSSVPDFEEKLMPTPIILKSEREHVRKLEETDLDYMDSPKEIPMVEFEDTEPMAPIVLPTINIEVVEDTNGNGNSNNQPADYYEQFNSNNNNSNDNESPDKKKSKVKSSKAPNLPAKPKSSRFVSAKPSKSSKEKITPKLMLSDPTPTSYNPKRSSLSQAMNNNIQIIADDSSKATESYDDNMNGTYEEAPVNSALKVDNFDQLTEYGKKTMEGFNKESLRHKKTTDSLEAPSFIKTFRKSFKGARKKVGEMAEKISSAVPDVSDKGYAKGQILDKKNSFKRPKTLVENDVEDLSGRQDYDEQIEEEEFNARFDISSSIEERKSTEVSFPPINTDSDTYTENMNWDRINEYYYSVRIFPGQNTKKIFVGWVTTRFQKYNTNYCVEDCRNTEIRILDAYGLKMDTQYLRDCVINNVNDLQIKLEQDAKISTSIIVGCYIDPSQGRIRYTLNGKDDVKIFKVNPNSRLYPAIFFESPNALNKDILQVELGRVSEGLPISTALFKTIKNKHVPQTPPRLKVQILLPKIWSRVNENAAKVHSLKLSETQGWSMLTENLISSLAIKIPEEDRCLNILELIEYPELMNFHCHTLRLFCSLCSHSNTRVSHMLCTDIIDRDQLTYCLKSQYMSGFLRNRFADLLIAMFIKPHSKYFELTKNEYIIPLTRAIRSFRMFKTTDQNDWFDYFLKSKISISFKPDITQYQKEASDMINFGELNPPPFPLKDLKSYVLTSLKDAVLQGVTHMKDPIGGSFSMLFVPLLKITNKLIIMNYLSAGDILMLLTLIDPDSIEGAKFEYTNGGLLDMKLDEDIKFQICLLLKYICDLRLRFKIESIVGFSEEFCKNLQKDQMYRYHEIKNSDLPAPLAAKMTKEFRCPPYTQMECLLAFKDSKNDEACHLRDEQKQELRSFYDSLLRSFGMNEDKRDGMDIIKLPWAERFANFIVGVKIVKDSDGSNVNSDTLCNLIVKAMTKWSKERYIKDQMWIREIFNLLYRQYNSHQEVYQALGKTYTIMGNSSTDFRNLLKPLVKIRSLLNVQMDYNEEKIMCKGLWDLANNKIFFQHPDLIRILGVHENVIEVMINTLNKISEGTISDSTIQESNCDIITACCRFLCFFCRTGAKNQQAMFEHLGYMLDHATMLLDRPSLRGSTPLDVAYSSFLENTELCLALNESHLEKVIQYLARCGVQSNTKLLAKNYPDIGWDPVEGERFLDFLKSSVWVNGESLEENANLIVRLLIRRPESLGPALKGEGGGLLKAMKSAIRFSYETSPLYYDENDEDSIDLGKAILTFYSVLIELLGKCAVESANSQTLKAESVRARSILRSLVSLLDLQGILSLRFRLPSFSSESGYNGETESYPMPPGLIPDHKASIVLFLERVYGIPDQETLFNIMENGFLLDMREAIILNSEGASECDLALALNRYLCNVVFPFLVRNSDLFANAEQYSHLLNTTLLTTYKLSLCHSLTKNQRGSLSEFLVCFTRNLPPMMLYPLLKKCVIDIRVLNEYTFVPLRVLTWYYENNVSYFASTPTNDSSQYATDEEKKITNLLFYILFDSLSDQEYNHDLFTMALPCLTAIASALPPEYSIGPNLNKEMEKIHKIKPQDTHYQPNPIDISRQPTLSDFEFVVQQFAQHYHNSWASRKFERGWSYGSSRSDEEKYHPRLKPFEKLTEYEKDRYKEPIRDYIKTLIMMGWTIERFQDPDSSITNLNLLSRRRSSKVQEADPHFFNPKIVDMSNMTLPPDIEELSNNLAEKAHETWAKSFKEEMDNKHINCSILYVPYDLLTQKEKRKEFFRVSEFLKYLQLSGYRITKKQRKPQSKIFMGISGIHSRFALNLLEKCLQYTESAMNTTIPINANIRYAKKHSHHLPTQDAKFFFKVVLPLNKSYFSAHQNYFISNKDSINSGGGVSNNEKEILCRFMCKMASFLREKFFAFGSHISLAVSCLQAIINAIDFSSIAKLFPDLVRTSLTPFFGNIAYDIDELVKNLSDEKFADTKIYFGKGNGTLFYVQGVIYPLLTTLFNHFNQKNYGKDILIDDIQISAYKILDSLYSMSKLSLKYQEYPSIRMEMNNHRQGIGTCLATFSNTFPVAFLEPYFNKTNKFSIVGRVEEHSFEAQDVLNKLSSNIPTLGNLLKEVTSFANKGTNYEDKPDIIDVVLPLLCSYLTRWWSYKNGKNANSFTMVSTDDLNSCITDVLTIIDKNLGKDSAAWMPKLANYATPIIANSTIDLTKLYFIPILTKLRDHANLLQTMEDKLKYESYDQDDLTEYETYIQEDYMILIRDIYSAYPLLISYIDLYRSTWLKKNNPDAEKLYELISQIFKHWIFSQNFRRYEQNFMAKKHTYQILPTPITKITMSPKGFRKKSKKDKENSRVRKRERDGSESCVLSCLKRIIPVGLNMFDGKEQEIIQKAKQKLLEHVAEEKVRDIIFQNMESNDKHTNIHDSQNNWQSVLYSKIGKTVDHHRDLTVAEITENIFRISSVLQELHTVEHPPPTVKHSWQSILSSPRKRAVVACFRMVALHSLPRHKVINLFLIVFDKYWLSDVDPHEERMIDDLRCIHLIKRSDPETSYDFMNKAVEKITSDVNLPPGNIVTPNQITSYQPDLEGAFLTTLPLEGGTLSNEIDETILLSCERVHFNALTHIICCFSRMASSQDSSLVVKDGSGGKSYGSDSSPSSNIPSNKENVDNLYIRYCILMSKSCGGPSDEDEGDEGGGEDSKSRVEEIDMDETVVGSENFDAKGGLEQKLKVDESGSGGGQKDEEESYQDQEVERLKLLAEQLLLADCGVSEMVLLYISQSKGTSGIMLKTTLELGISILKGGNTDIQKRMLKYLQEKKDVEFFTSTSSLMGQSSVLDLENFERNVKAESLGVDLSNSVAGKNMEDYELTCVLFRFLQLLCEGHNLDFQNYLRTQIGNTTTVNLVISTVDYLLQLQESIMDFYWHYSGKLTIDRQGVLLFSRGIKVSKQVFNTLTELIQGPCLQNQLALAHSRLWDAIGGFIFLFSNMQNKLSKNIDQMGLLTEFFELQKDMIIMMLSILEGNVMNGTIGKQMVETLMESSSNLEMILRYFDMFLKFNETIETPIFVEYDLYRIGLIHPKNFKKALEMQKIYNTEEIDFLIKCCETNKDGKINYSSFSDRFDEPAKEIGFNLAVLLTNLQEHMTNEPRFTKFLSSTESFLRHFEPFLGRIEIMGSNNRIERVYFEIKQSHIDQWEKPQIKESKRAFLHSMVNEGGDKEKLDSFVNFCEDSIFEMKHASSLSAEDSSKEAKIGEVQKDSFKIPLINMYPKEFMSYGWSYAKTHMGQLNFIEKWKNCKKKLIVILKMTWGQRIRKMLQITWIFIKDCLANTFYTLCILKEWVSIMMKGCDFIEEQKHKKDSHSLKSLMQTTFKKPLRSKGKAKWDFVEDMEAPMPSSVFGIELANKMDHERTSLPDFQLDDISIDALMLGGDDSQRYSFVKKMSTQLSNKMRDKSMVAGSDKPIKSLITTQESSRNIKAKSSARNTGYRIIDTRKLYGFFARNFYNIKYIALALAFAINFLLLFFKVNRVAETEIEYEINNSTSLNMTEEVSIIKEYVNMDEEATYFRPLIQILSITHIFVSLAMLIGYYYLKVPLSIFKREKEISRKLEFDGMWIEKQPGEEDIKDHWDKLVISTPSFPSYYWDKLVKKKVLAKYSETHDANELRNLLGLEQEINFNRNETPKMKGYGKMDMKYETWKLGITLTDNSFLYILFYFIFSLLGNYNHFFFAAHLLDIAIGFKTLRTILMSVTHNGKQLLLTFMMTSIIVYIYAVIAFNFFRKFYIQDEDGSTDYKCHDMLSCFVFHLYKGVRAGGGIGDEIEAPDGDPKEAYRIIFDITFFFFVIVILLAIIQGLIIDAFGELRDQLEQVKEDMEANCFICGIGKDYFDKVPHGFEIHTKKEHDLANYMFFLMHLINKPETEFTGQETYVWRLYQQRCWDFFPVGDCFRKQYEENIDTN